MEKFISNFSTPKASTLTPGTQKELAVKSSRMTRKRPRTKERDNLFQTVLDAGQKKIGLEHCSSCGMVYNFDDMKDVEQHSAFHNRFNATRNFRVTVNQIQSWKSSLHHEEIFTPVNGIIFHLKTDSKCTLRHKFEDIVRNYIDVQLGYCSDLPIWGGEKEREALVFVVSSRNKQPAFIGGIVLGEIVDQAILMPKIKSYKGIFLGVDRIWIHIQLRRKGIATLLLDTALRLIVRQDNLPRSRVAFGDPTDVGIRLAINYVGDKENERYVVYTSKSKNTERKKLDDFVKKFTI